MVNDYAHSTRLPKWAQANGESYVMVGSALRGQRRQGRGLGTHGPDPVVVHDGHHCA